MKSFVRKLLFETIFFSLVSKFLFDQLFTYKFDNRSFIAAIK